MIIESEQINLKTIEALANEDALAIKVKNFISKDLANALTEKIMAEGYRHYINAPSIGRIGMAFYEAEGRPELLEEYFEKANYHINELRDRCSPYVSPIDLLRCKLDEQWPAGAHLENLYGKKMFVGLSRVVEPNVYFLAHHDIFSKDAADSYHAKSLRGQFACNVYLNMPNNGGEIQIWRNEISAREFDGMRGDSYGIDPALLGDPCVEIKPEIGDVVIFNSRKMHAVTPSKDDARLSLSCFIGYRGTHAPLTFWS